MWAPKQGQTELFATTGDFFRLFELVIPDDQSSALLIQKATLANVRRMGQVNDY